MTTPYQWPLTKLKYVSRLEYGEALPSEVRHDGQINVYGSNGVVGTHTKSNTTSSTIIVGRKGSYGKIQLSSNPCFVIDTALYIEQSATINNIKWLYYLLIALKLDKQEQLSTVPGLNRNLVHDTTIPLPPLETQRQIAAFLDRKTEAIDALIEKKQRLIELLEEKRTALINHVVTKGLDPDVPMKDSGVPWIGQIPEGWEVIRNKYIFREYSDLAQDENHTLLTVSHITGITERESKENVTMFKSESLIGYKKCEPNILVINTMWAWMGALGISNHYGVVSPAYNTYKTQPPNNPTYYENLFKTSSYISYITTNSTGIRSSRLRLYPSAFGNLTSPLPPQQTQNQIVAYIHQKTKSNTIISSNLKQQIEKLQEYRQALITAAVTGQLDIKNDRISDDPEEMINAQRSLF